MDEKNYLSIGEVLGLLLDEFPDVTISKIRFLESQGLIEPERTPSGTVNSAGKKLTGFDSYFANNVRIICR
jgi:hypothetical protein